MIMNESTVSLIRKFSIKKLFGYKDLCLNFENPIRILIGENGYGKTTILNALYYLLKGKYEKLLEINFESISIELKESYFFSKELIQNYCDYLSRLKSNQGGLVTFIKDNLSNEEWGYVIENIQKKDMKDSLISVFQKNPIFKQIPAQLIYDQVLNFTRGFKKISIFTIFIDFEREIEKMNVEILYFPTYRRVEEDMKNLVSAAERKEGNDALLIDNSIIKFGMDDVENRIKKITNTIFQSSVSGFNSVYGSIITQLLKEDEKQEQFIFDNQQLKIVLNRIGRSLSLEEKNAILSRINSTDNKLNGNLAFFLKKLVDVYKQQEKYDTALKLFTDKCNEYLVDKSFYYDESEVTLKLYRKKYKDDLSEDFKDELKLKQLSSGEKQIVSIFSKIYLEIDKKYIILFDEPELSLSLYWQRNFLPDICDSQQCQFLLAVTHSPFIFENKLEIYTTGIREFAECGEKA
jgi:predicted ATPase